MVPEEQTIVLYLGGLRLEIYDVFQLPPSWTYNDVFKLAIKVECQLKAWLKMVVEVLVLSDVITLLTKGIKPIRPSQSSKV